VLGHLKGGDSPSASFYICPELGVSVSEFVSQHYNGQIFDAASNPLGEKTNYAPIRTDRCAIGNHIVTEQERLAFDAGIDRSYLGGLERREENPTVDILDRLAKTLSVSISEFFVSPGKGSLPPKPLISGRRPAR
jgi:hypothetical protein